MDQPDEGPVLIAESDARVGGNFGCGLECSTVVSTKPLANTSKWTLQPSSL